MAGMFYSLQQAAEKLNKTEDEIKQLVKDGKLQEFRTGENLLLKVDEVEALMSDTTVMPSEPTQETGVSIELQAEEEEISLVSEDTEEDDSELTEADTIVSGQSPEEGVNVLEETDSDYILSEDTTGETKAESEEVSLTSAEDTTLSSSGETALASSADEASLEEIEEDVNLDTFGSGSGLLDLSLQADDTSLGGILDEIYTPAGEEPQGPGVSGPGTELATETEIVPEGDFAAMEPGVEAAAIARAYPIEAEPDAVSNALGIMLFLPLLAVLYTAVVAMAGFNNIMPSILEKIQGIIWYIVGAAVVVALVIAMTPLILSGTSEKAPKKPKAKKAKKVKKPKKPKQPKIKKKKNKKSKNAAPSPESEGKASD